MENLWLISSRTLDDYVDRYPEVVILDVRPREEFLESHIRHAVNLPYEEGRQWNLPKWKEIVVYCERGSASMMAARELCQQGYRVVSVAGGIWEYRGRNLVFSC